MFILSQMMITTLRAQTCPTFGFFLEEPYYEEFYGLWPIDVLLIDFGGLNAAGINLRIDYTNNDIEIDQTRTEESLLSEIKEGCNGSFTFGTGTLTLGGIQPPLDEGPILTNDDSKVIFVVYFSSAAGQCSDFMFEDTELVVSFPLLNDWIACTGDVGSGCEIDNYCIPGFMLGGTIESPILDCDDSEDGGIIGIAVEIEESNNIPLFNCSTETDTYGDYECFLAEGLDYRITPVHDFNRTCGLSSLDIDIYFDHLLGTDCIDDVWTFLSGDVDQNGILNVDDLGDIQEAILEIDGVDWASWTFVPSSAYNGMSVPSCLSMNYNVIPAYDPYIDIVDLDDEYTNLDFVGIKMGDANGTCTVCSQLFTGEEIAVRSTSQLLDLTNVGKEEYTLSFPADIKGLEVLMLAFTCSVEPQIKWSALQNRNNFVTLFRIGIFYISYASSIDKGEHILKDQPFLVLEGNLADSKEAGSRIQNEIIVDNKLSSVDLRSRIRPLTEVYPNPTKGEISIVLDDLGSGEIATISIHSLQGTKLIEKTILEKVSAMDLRLQPGVYYYLIKSKRQARSAKLIIH